MQKDKITALQNNYYRQQLKNAQFQKGATSQGLRTKTTSALDDTYGNQFYTTKRKRSNVPQEEETHYQDNSLERNEYSANYEVKHAHTAYGTLVNG